MPVNKKSLENLRPAKKGEARNTKPADQHSDKRFIALTTAEELAEWNNEASKFRSRRAWINHLREELTMLHKLRFILSDAQEEISHLKSDLEKYGN